MVTRANVPERDDREQIGPSELVDVNRSQTIASVERAADVLLHFANSTRPTLGITEIANDLSMSKAAVHRLLTSLRTRGLIAVDEASRRYSLGPEALMIGLSALNRLDVRRLAASELPLLSEDTGETATLSVRTGMSRIYVDQVTPAREVIMTVSIGVPYPLHAGSSSKAFLAYMSESEIELVLSGSLSKITPSTVVDTKALRAELRRIRQRGWATSTGERQSGAASVAAPIFDHRGIAQAVVSVSGPADRFGPNVDAHVARLLSTTVKLSTRMGFHPTLGGQ